MNDSEQLSEIMTLKETAAYLRCSQRHIQNLLVRGLPHFRLGSLVRFRREEVMGYLMGNPQRRLHRRRAEIREAA